MIETRHIEERREGYVEMPHDFVDKINSHINTEEGFQRGLKLFIGIFSSLVSVILGIVVWVLVEKNTDIKETQKTIIVHTVQNAEMLQLIKGLVETNARQQDRIDKNTEILYGLRKK